MAEKVIWTCDGCDKSLDTSKEAPHDWKLIDVTLGGFHGFPVSDQFNVTRSFHLCPSCQSRLVTEANPVSWHRAAAHVLAA